MLAGGKLKQRKPEQRPDQQRQRRGDEPLADRDRRDEERDRADARHAGGEAVHVVEEVERVGDGGDPEDGEDDRRDGSRSAVRARRDGFSSDERRGDGELDEQLGVGAQRLAVVPEAHEVQDEARAEEAAARAASAARTPADEAAVPSMLVEPCVAAGRGDGVRRQHDAASEPPAIGSANARKIATPPPSAIGLLWILRWPGLSTKPTRIATRRTRNVPTSERTKLTPQRLSRGRIILASSNPLARDRGVQKEETRERGLFRRIISCNRTRRLTAAGCGGTRSGPSAPRAGG